MWRSSTGRPKPNVLPVSEQRAPAPARDRRSRHPPTTVDALEDWLSVPANDSDIRIRVATLRRHAARTAPAVSIEDGVLRVGIRLVVLPPIEAPASRPHWSNR